MITSGSSLLLNLLKSVGIFHENPKDAADHLAFISEDIESWWHSKDVQDVVVKFALRFAKNNNNLLDDLTRILKEQN